MAYDEGMAARVRRALGARRDVTEKRMFGGIAFLVRGHMAMGLIGTTLMVRVDPAEEAALLRQPHVRPMDFTGRPLRGFLFVDAPGIGTAPALRGWVARATARAEAQPARDERGLSVRVTPRAKGARAKAATPAKAATRARTATRGKTTRAKAAPRTKAARAKAAPRRVPARAAKATRTRAR